jgi:hypothetical protein
MNYRDAIRSTRNRLRKFSYGSVLENISNHLRNHSRPGHDHLQKLPWVAERLGVWLLRDDPRMYGNKIMLPANLQDCIGRAFETMDQVVDWEEKSKEFSLFFRSTMLSQIPHQQKIDVGAFARQIKLIMDVEPNSRLRHALDNALGMSAKDYLQLAVFFWARDLDDPFGPFSGGYLSSLRKAFGGEVVQQFMGTMVFPVADVREKFSASEPDEDEWFQPCPLYPFPYLVDERRKLFFFWGTRPA